MDIFMMCSSFEGLPIAMLEAMSMNTAILTTDAGGIKEVIRPQIDGMIVPVSEWKRHTENLLKLAQNPTELERLKAASRMRAMEAFSLKVMVQQLEAAYQNHAK
jgi:L-malate glycosyltransferase